MSDITTDVIVKSSTRRCKVCQIEKDVLSCFTKSRTSVCRVCQRNQRMIKTYGITGDDYDLLAQSQDGVCWICEQPTARLVVDHIHTNDSAKPSDASDAVRGLLCGSCNRGLGYFKDNPYYLVRACVYLQKKPAQLILAKHRLATTMAPTR